MMILFHFPTLCMHSIPPLLIYASAFFCWATFRPGEGAIKLHTQYDVRTSIPVFMHVSAASVHDINLMNSISYEPGSFYIFDRGYLDFERLHTIQHSGSFFVIRARTNLKFKRMYSSVVDKSTGVRCDQIGQLKWFYSLKGYPEKIRRIKFYDSDQKRTFVFLTNNTELKAEEIADLYKNRWKIELFFKWIKQHLRITTFLGTNQERSENSSLHSGNHLYARCNNPSEVKINLHNL